MEPSVATSTQYRLLASKRTTSSTSIGCYMQPDIAIPLAKQAKGATICDWIPLRYAGFDFAA
ncbi:response regulator [Anopheles sinensis]|uniref:Response regulator n=1 Tax=Anopheles sinensis TaxID=74873 RepID=A0A084WNB2_ANOSI|nr:response regulator [Anopheles sinensis]